MILKNAFHCFHDLICILKFLSVWLGQFCLSLGFSLYGKFKVVTSTRKLVEKMNMLYSTFTINVCKFKIWEYSFFEKARLEIWSSQRNSLRWRVWVWGQVDICQPYLPLVGLALDGSQWLCETDLLFASGVVLAPFGIWRWCTETPIWWLIYTLQPQQSAIPI